MIEPAGRWFALRATFRAVCHVSLEMEKACKILPPNYHPLGPGIWIDMIYPIRQLHRQVPSLDKGLKSRTARADLFFSRSLAALAWT